MSIGPQRFGQYILLRPLGFGGMGKVYLAIAGRKGLETVCVIKRLLPELLERPDQIDRFRHEADLARRLKHGNLVHTHAVDEVDGEVFLVQEYVEGQDVSALLEKLASQGRRLPVPVSAYIAASIARGLHYAHDFENLDLVHRDVNAPNVRLTYDGEVKLLDFGIASSKLQGEEEANRRGAGKIAYMAPEQVLGARLDRRTDLYAVGALLWEMLTGHPLGTKLVGGVPELPEGGRLASVERVLRAEFLPPSAFNREVAPELDKLVAKLLARNPDDRPASAEEVRAVLASCIPHGFSPEQALSLEMTRLFSRDLEKADREALITDARALPDAAPPREPTTTTTAPSKVPARWHRFAATAVLVGLVFAVVVIAVGRRTVPSPAPAAPPLAAQESPTRGRPDERPQARSEALVAIPAAVAVRPGPAVAPPTPRQTIVTKGGEPVRRSKRGTVAEPARSESPEAADPRPSPPARPAEAAPDIDDVALAKAAFNKGDWSRAIAHGEKAVGAGRGAAARSILGATYFRMGRYADAEREFQAAHELRPDDALINEKLQLSRRKRQAAAAHPRAPEAP